MRAPLVAVYLRSVGRLSKRARTAEAERDNLADLCLSLTADLDDCERERDAWKRRAEALFEALDPELAVGIVGTLTTIESLPTYEREG